MESKASLFREMKMNRKIGNDILFCEITHETLMQHFFLPKDFNSHRTRKREYVYARQIAMMLISKYTRFSLAKIGQEFGGRDHATVLHACRTVVNLSETDKQFRHYLEDLEKKLTIQ